MREQMSEIQCCLASSLWGLHVESAPDSRVSGLHPHPSCPGALPDWVALWLGKSLPGGSLLLWQLGVSRRDILRCGPQALRRPQQDGPHLSTVEICFFPTTSTTGSQYMRRSCAQPFTPGISAWEEGRVVRWMQSPDVVSKHGSKL